MKTHAAEGARIVGKFGRLRDGVAIIRHHHERFDGAGYPDGSPGTTFHSQLRWSPSPTRGMR